jgi:hypothetical protein
MTKDDVWLAVILKVLETRVVGGGDAMYLARIADEVVKEFLVRKISGGLLEEKQ